MRRRYTYQSRYGFFGLNDEYIEGLYEHFFYMKYYGGWGFVEAYNLPIKIRNWFLQRLIEEKQLENETVETEDKKYM